MKGEVKWFNNSKGFGFVNNKDKDDIFIHYSAINMEGYKSLETGQLVKFELIKTNKGLQGKNVELISK